MMKVFRRSWILIALWTASLVTALNAPRPAFFFHISYLFGAVLIASFVWAWLNISWVKITRQTFTRRSQVGELVEERFWVENRGLLPKLWLELRDYSTLPAHRASHVISGLGSRQRQNRIIRTLCLRRGRYRLGPITVSSGDPFGLFIMERDLLLMAQLVVYPQSVPLPYFSPLMGEITGGEAAYRRTHHITANVAGVREYAPGDSFKRIHWPSTARANRLITKEFELDPLADMWVVLDMHKAIHFGENNLPHTESQAPVFPWQRWEKPDLYPSTVEYSIVVTASLLLHFLRRKMTVGLITYHNGEHSEVVPGDRGERQEDRLLEILAVAHAYGSISLEQVLVAEGTRFNRNTTLIVVTSSLSPEWVAAVRHLASRGVKVTTVFIDPHSFGGPNETDSFLTELTLNHIPTYVVKKGDKLEEALANAPRPM